MSLMGFEFLLAVTFQALIKLINLLNSLNFLNSLNSLNFLDFLNSKLNLLVQSQQVRSD